MTEAIRESIDKDVGLVPAGSISKMGAASYFDSGDKEYSVSVTVPVVGAASVVVAGKGESCILRVTTPEADGGTPLLTTKLEVLDNVRDVLNSFVEVVVAADELLVEDLTGTIYIDETCEAITREQVAVEAIPAAGGVGFYWDSRLCFPLITLADPLFHFSGTFSELLEALIAPYKFPGVSLAEILIEPDEIRVLYTEPGTQSIVELVIGSDIYLESLDIRKVRPKQIRNVSASWYTPKVLDEETVTLVDERFDKDGFIIGRTIHILKMRGNVLLEEEELNYAQIIVNWMISGGPIVVHETKHKPYIYLQYKKHIVYTHDPVPNASNVHYVRNFKLMERLENVVYYVPSSGDTGILWYEDEIVSSYTYDTDGNLSCETQRTAKNRAGYGEQGYVTGEIVTIKYSSISEDIYQMGKDTSSFRAYVVEGDQEWPQPGDINALSHITQTVMGSLPSSPSIPVPKNTDYVEDHERKEEVADYGADAHVEMVFDPGTVFDLFFNRLISHTFNVSIYGRCLYDLRPGLWVKLVMGKDVTVTTKSPSGSEEKTKFSAITNSLPTLFVRSATVEKEDKEQKTRIELVGWRLPN